MRQQERKWERERGNAKKLGRRKKRGENPRAKRYRKKNENDRRKSEREKEEEKYILTNKMIRKSQETSCRTRKVRVRTIKRRVRGATQSLR